MTRSPARYAALAAALVASTAAGAVSAEALVDRCTSGQCHARLTAQELLGEVQGLIAAGRYAEARPLLAALAQVPGLRFEYRFLSGYVAQKTDDYGTAAAFYRAILTDDPGQTRVRLELARVMLMQGKRQSADRQFRLAEEDPDLPPEIARTIRATRDVIRSQKAWSLNVDAGLAPDSNINNATSADSINVYLGGQAVPLTLDQAARARSGVGRYGSIDAGLRLPTWGETMMLVDVDAVGTDYDGRAYDDIAVEAAVGPELPLADGVRVRAQAVAAQRLFGGRVAMRQAGLKGGGEAMLGRRDRLGLQFDARRTFQAFDPGYTGWQLGGYATLEHVVAKAVVASAGVFVRRDALKTAAFSSIEGGVLAGIGGELPLGLNLAVSGTASRAAYDAPMFFFSDQPRRDWRYSARATIGVRAFRIAGLSPSFNVSVSRIDSSIDFYATTRTRYRFALARYF